MEVVPLLVPLLADTALLGDGQREAVSAGFAEYRSVQRFSADLPVAQVNLAQLLMQSGEGAAS